MTFIKDFPIDSIPNATSLLLSSFETSDGVAKQEQGELKTFGPESAAVVARGSYSFLGDDGVTYTVNYVADENGFKAEGAHLPVAPVA